MDSKHEPGDLTEDVDARDPRESTKEADGRRGVEKEGDEHDPHEMTEDSKGRDPHELVGEPDADEAGSDR